jgi:hypothetical protein
VSAGFGDFCDTQGMNDEDPLLAWFDVEGFDVHVSQVGEVWTASALLRSQRIGAATTETGMTRAEALEHLRTKLKDSCSKQGGSLRDDRDALT